MQPGDSRHVARWRVGPANERPDDLDPGPRVPESRCDSARGGTNEEVVEFDERGVGSGEGNGLEGSKGDGGAGLVDVEKRGEDGGHA